MSDVDQIYKLRQENERLQAKIGELRELLAAAYIELSGSSDHASDCATSDSPAYTPSKCDCDEPCNQSQRENR